MDQRTGAERYFDEQLKDPAYRDAYERERRPSLWRLRWRAWWGGVPVRDLWGISATYRHMKRVPPLVPSRPNPTIVEVDSSPGWLRAVVLLVWSGVLLLGVYAALLAGGVIR